MTLITTARSALRGGDPTRVPEWTQAILIDPARCARLGSHNGRDWYDWPAQRLEVEEVGELIDRNSPAIGESPHFKVPQPGGGYMLQPLRAHVRGTYAPAFPSSPGPRHRLPPRLRLTC